MVIRRLRRDRRVREFSNLYRSADSRYKPFGDVLADRPGIPGGHASVKGKAACLLRAARGV